jgi:hypothetical protein
LINDPIDYSLILAVLTALVIVPGLPILGAAVFVQEIESVDPLLTWFWRAPALGGAGRFG